MEIYAMRWHEAQKDRWSAVHVRKVEQALRRDVLPDLGRVPISEIDGPMLLRTLRKVEARGAIDTAKRIRQHMSAIFQFAMAEGVAAGDPAAGIVKGLRPSPPAGQQPAVRSIEEAREILRTMDASTSDPQTKLASRLLALTAVRPGIVRAATWSEIEGVDWTDPGAPSPAAFWRIPAARMKLEQEDKTDKAFEHLVPLPEQAVAVLRQLRRLSGAHEFIFRSVRSSTKPMSENTIGYMYARNGYSGRHVPHGWRATFSTVMNERAVAARRLEDRPIIDGMLAHKLKGISGSEMAYNRAIHWSRRCELAAEWADLLMKGLPHARSIMT
ncbi:MAG: integrase [Alphaproteobacteria bacterium]|nr:MAG: integrase [Alphaproteobacteria bacterium]